MKRMIALGTALVLLGSVAGAAEQDVFGRRVPDAEGRWTVVLYANRETKDAVSAPMTDLAFALRDTPLRIVVRVDLRGIPSLFEGFAYRAMRNDARTGLERFRARYREAGLTPPEGESRGLYFIADSDGSTHRKEGLPEGFEHARAVLFAPDGHVVLEGPFPESAAEIERAVRSAPAEQLHDPR